MRELPLLVGHTSCMARVSRGPGDSSKFLVLGRNTALEGGKRLRENAALGHSPACLRHAAQM
jgi:hypothetical protein